MFIIELRGFWTLVIFVLLRVRIVSVSLILVLVIFFYYWIKILLHNCSYWFWNRFDFTFAFGPITSFLLIRFTPTLSDFVVAVDLRMVLLFFTARLNRQFLTLLEATFVWSKDSAWWWLLNVSKTIIRFICECVGAIILLNFVPIQFN